jgi:2-methylcitrate dehydratase PrpD
MNIEKTLISCLRNLTYENLSNHVIEKVKTILLHDFVVGIAGKHRKEVISLSNYYAENKVLDRVFLRSLEMSAPTLEDFYGANHFGPLIIPNALYHGLESKADGRQFLTAVVSGFETAILLSDLLGELSGSKGFRETPLFGVMAAAAAAAHVSGSNEDEWFNALAHASANTFGVGISLLAGTSEWRFQASLGAYHAALAFLLSRQGFDGYPEFINGNRGLSEVFTGKKVENLEMRDFDGASLLKVGVKRHPVHILVLSAVEAADRLVKQNGLYVSQNVEVIQIRIPSHQSPQMILQKGPYSKTNQAIVSIFTNVALTLLYGDCTLLPKANDADVLEFVNKIEVSPDDTLNSFELELNVSIMQGGKHAISISNPEDLYFPSFAQEYTYLLAETVHRGMSQECVHQLADEIMNIDQIDSLTKLVQIYEQF